MGGGGNRADRPPAARPGAAPRGAAAAPGAPRTAMGPLTTIPSPARPPRQPAPSSPPPPPPASQDFNRDLLFDIKLLSVYPKGGR
jgi:hypothetical protein